MGWGCRARRCASLLVLQQVTLLLMSGNYQVFAAVPEPDEKLIGWLGETYVAGVDGASAERDPSGMRVVSWDPRIMHYRRFLTEVECDQLRELARPRLQRSGVSDAITGEHKLDNVRTSKGMFFERGENELVRRIEARVAMVTMLPVGNAEGMQVLQYAETQEYKPHHDYFSFAGRDKNGGNRMATILIYLTDVEKGGETVFPKVRKAPEQTLENGWSNCSLQTTDAVIVIHQLTGGYHIYHQGVGLAVKPRKGDATIFWSIRPDGTFDHKSLHGSCPVIAGEKWSATKWIHVAHFADKNEEAKEVHRVIFAPPPPPVPAWCQDKNKQCAIWAESGECEANPGFMVGSKEQPGSCLASCHRCDLHPKPRGMWKTSKQ